MGLQAKDPGPSQTSNIYIYYIYKTTTTITITSCLMMYMYMNIYIYILLIHSTYVDQNKCTWICDFHNDHMIYVTDNIRKFFILFILYLYFIYSSSYYY